MRRALGLLLAFVVAVVILATGAQAGTRGATVANVTLGGWSSGPDEDALLQQVLDKFNQTHPTVRAHLSIINTDYTKSMASRFAAHDPPDVFYVDSSVAPTWE